MAFGTDLQGPRSHEALLAVQDAEIRLLETVKKCTTQRIKCDREYASALSAILSIARKQDMVQYPTPTTQVVVIALSSFLSYDQGISFDVKKKKILHRQLGLLCGSSSPFSPLSWRGLNPIKPVCDSDQLDGRLNLTASAFNQLD